MNTLNNYIKEGLFSSDPIENQIDYKYIIHFIYNVLFKDASLELMGINKDNQQNFIDISYSNNKKQFIVDISKLINKIKLLLITRSYLTISINENDIKDMPDFHIICDDDSLVFSLNIDTIGDKLQKDTIKLLNDVLFPIPIKIIKIFPKNKSTELHLDNVKINCYNNFTLAYYSKSSLYFDKLFLKYKNKSDIINFTNIKLESLKNIYLLGNPAMIYIDLINKSDINDFFAEVDYNLLKYDKKYSIEDFPYLYKAFKNIKTNIIINIDFTYNIKYGKILGRSNLNIEIRDKKLSIY